jgi:hypothetical protein
MRIKGNGDVSIGNPLTTQTARLEVSEDFGTTSNTTALRISSVHGGSYTGASQLEFAYNDRGNVNVPNLIATINATSSVTSSSNVGGILSFATKALGGATTALPVTRMTITAGGLVGIASQLAVGTTSADTYERLFVKEGGSVTYSHASNRHGAIVATTGSGA